MEQRTRSSVCFIFRKKDPLFFSIERVFALVIPALHSWLDISIGSVPEYSSSLSRIWLNIKAVRKYKAAIFHVTGDIHYTVLGLPGKKTVLTIHDCVFLQQAAGIKRQLLKRIWLTWPVRRAAIITTISEKSKKEIIDHTGCRPGKIVVIPNPIGEHIYHTPKEFNRQRPVILFIGSTPNKNLDRVIPALQGIECVLEIIGKISVQQADLLQQLNIEYRTMEQITDEVLANRYAQCDMVLFPSTYEGFGLPITEAQKAGRPVITSNISPMKEVAGEAACLVDPYSIDSIREGVLRLIRDPSYREDLVTKGLVNVGHYDQINIAEQYLACYRKLK